jgi:hypothetical protein
LDLKFKLFGLLLKAKNEANQSVTEENIKVGKNPEAVLIRELVEGQKYEFGEPWQLTSDSLSAIIPILRRFVGDRKYLVLQEIPEDKVDVRDSGRINNVSVILKDVKKPVFVRAGTIFKGQGTQSRTSGTGLVLEPDKENLVEVFCVHATHPIAHRSGFRLSSATVPRMVEDVLMSPAKSQAGIWEATAVRAFRASVTHCPQCGSSSLLQNYEAELVCEMWVCNCTYFKKP